jgi:opacity protein-like surface antigen
MKNLLFLMAATAVILLPASVSAQSYGYYSDFRAGGSFLADASNTSPGGINVESEFDTGFAGEIAVGWEEPSGFRYELALGYAQYGVGDLTIIEDGGIGVAAGVGDLDGSSVGGDGDVGAFTYMINGYYAFGSGMVQPYVGAGIGGAYVSADISALGVEVVDDSDNVFAYQGTVGLEYRISDYAAIGARYTYFATTDPTFRDTLGVEFDSEVQSHNAMITFRFFSG